jgi:hypothetical protein
MATYQVSQGKAKTTNLQAAGKRFSEQQASIGLGRSV